MGMLENRIEPERLARIVVDTVRKGSKLEITFWENLVGFVSDVIDNLRGFCSGLYVNK